jgi:Flp pilus assembly secretin CpaC
MTRNFSVTAGMVAAIAALLASADRVPAAERVARNSSGYCLQDPCPPDSGTSHRTSTAVSNDGNSRFVALVVNKSIALDMPSDVSDVLIGSPTVANVILRSKRRAYIVGTGLGQTNVYFYDSKGQQIDGLNVNVSHHVISERIPAREILVVRGADENVKQIQVYECEPICALAENATPAPPTTPTYLVLPNVTSLPKP